MVRAKLKDDDDDGNTQNGAEKPIDAKRAVKIMREDILPQLTTIGEHSQEMSTAYKAIKKECNVPSWVMKLAIKLMDTEDFKREHELRALEAMLIELGLSISEDLVDRAQGKGREDGKVIPRQKASERPRLVTVSNGQETDLADAADDEFDNAAPKPDDAE